MGIIYTWPSGLLKVFESNETILDRPMTQAEISLLGSLSCLAPLISTPLSGYFMNVVGRKYIAIGTSFLPLITWLIISSVYKVEAVLTALFIGGLAGNAILIIPLYVGEICQESIRGTMAACCIIFYSIGMMASYALASLEYKAMIYTNLTLAVLGVFGVITVLKETPVFLIKKGLEQEAAKTIAYYRKLKINSKEVLSEMESLKRALNPEIELQTMSSEQEKLHSANVTPQRKDVSVWEFFKKSPSTRRALFVGFGMILSIFQGLPAIQVYADPLFAQAVPSMSSTVGSVLLAAVAIVFGVIAGLLTDVLGRKSLMIYSSLANGICSVVLGIQLQLCWGPQWISAMLIYLFAIFFTFGAGTVPYVIISEIYLPEVSNIMSMIIVEMGWLINFVVVLIYQLMDASLGPGPVFYFFACVCFFITVFTAIFLPETKGLSLEAIQTLFVSNKRRQSMNI